MEIDFPRGREESVLKLRKDVHDDVVKLDSGLHKKARHTIFREEIEAQGLSKENIKKTKFLRDKLDIVWTDSLNHKTLTPNLLALGCVSAVYEHEIKIELIDGQHASIPLTKVSSLFLEHLSQPKTDKRCLTSILSQVYDVGQFVIAKILLNKEGNVDRALSQKNNHFYTATTDPKEVNENLLLSRLEVGQTLMASIKSVEEKGLVMDIGSPTLFGFLPFAHADISSNSALTGLSLLCTVAQSFSSNERVVQLTRRLSHIANDNETSLTVSRSAFNRRNQLLPGCRFYGIVHKVTSSGLYFRFADDGSSTLLSKMEKSSIDSNLCGFVSCSKLPVPFSDVKSFEPESRILLTITYSMPNTTMIGYSAQERLMNGDGCGFFRLPDPSKSAPFSNQPIGKRCKAVCKLVSSKRNGVYFELISDKDDKTDESRKGQNVALVYGFCPAFLLKHTAPKNDSQDTVEPDREKYIAGKSRHNVRITGHCLMGGLLYLSDSDEALIRPVVDVEHAKIGSLVEARVVKATEKGLRVRLYNAVNGFIPTFLMDYSLDGKTIKNYPKGKIIQARVWDIELQKNRLILVAKTAFLKSSKNEHILASYNRNFINTVHRGVTVYVNPNGNGLLISFYNKVKGYLKLDDAAKSLTDEFYVGRVINAQIEDVDEKQKKMRLRLANMTPEDVLPDLSKKGALESVNQEAMDAVNDSSRSTFYVRVLGATAAGDALRVLTDSDATHTMEAILPGCHLTDSSNPDDWSLLVSSFQPDDRIGPCVMFARGVSPIVTSKPLIVQTLVDHTNPIIFDQLEENQLVAGVITRIHPDLGYFVQLAGGELTGLASFSNVDQPINDDATQSSRLVVGQSVLGRVQKVDVEKRRFRLSLRSIECARGDYLQNALELLKRTLDERHRILSFVDKNLPPEDPRRTLLDNSMEIGSSVECTVNTVTDFGLICTLDNGIRGVAVVEQLSKPVAHYSENCRIQAVVISIDVGNCCVELSTSLLLLKRAKNLGGRTDKCKTLLKSVQIGQRIHAVVILCKPDSILISLLDHAEGLLLAYLPGRLHYNDTVEHTRYTVGERVGAIIKEKYRLAENTVVVLAHDARNEQLYAEGSAYCKIRKVTAKCSTGRSPRKLSTGDPSPVESGDGVSNNSTLIRPMPNIVTVQVGKVYDATILSRDGFFFNLYINKSQAARVHVTELCDHVIDGQDFFVDRKYSAGQRLRVKVVDFRKSGSDSKIRIAECTAKESKVSSRNNKRRNIGFQTNYERGQKVAAFVEGFTKNDSSLRFIVGIDWRGTCQRLNLSDDLQVLQNIENAFTEGRAYNAFILAVQPKEKRLVLSLIPPESRAVVPLQPALCKMTSLDPGIALHFSLVDGSRAFCPLTDVSNDFDKTTALLPSMQSGHVMKAKPVSLLKGHRWRLTAREDDQKSCIKDPVISTVNDLKVGHLVRGFVLKITQKGCLINLGYRIIGRLPWDQDNDDAGSKPVLGQLTKCVIVSINRRTNKVLLRLASPFDDCLPTLGKRAHSESEEPNESCKRSKLEPVVEEENKPCLLIDGGFKWSSDRFSMRNFIEIGLTKSSEEAKSSELDLDSKLNSDEQDIKEECSSSGWSDEDLHKEEEELELGRKKRKKIRRKLLVEKMSEDELLQREASLLNPDRPIEHEQDFDRLLMGSPNSSVLWLRYMALFVQSGEIGKARLVAERALKTIDLRQEDERFNVWTAMLNMENTYGSPESLEKTFERARQVNEPVKVYKQLFRIYQHCGKTKEADSLAEEMLKKFKQNADIWLLCAEYFYSHEPKRADKGREVAKKAMQYWTLQNADNHKIEMASKFAQLEFKYADSERGKTLFEGLLNQWPKRTDLWAVYADMLMKYRSIEEARLIYERATSIKIPVHKLKSLYQKWTDFEQRHGDENSVKSVNERLECLIGRKNPQA